MITNTLKILSTGSRIPVEKAFDCKFVCESTIKNQAGFWMNQPVAIFYTENNKNKWHTNYIAIHPFEYNTVDVKFKNGEDALEEFVGVVADNGEIIYSRFRSDLVTSEDGSVWINGGRERLETNAKSTVRLKIIKDQIEVIK